MMKKLFLALLVLVALFGITTLEQWFLMTPAARAQTNTFCAANLACTVTGIWTFTGAATFGNLNNCFTVDGTLYTTIQAAINAAPATGCVSIPPGTYAPTSTITITKQLTVKGWSPNSVTIRPTSAVTGAAISINPAVQAQVTLTNFNLDMVNVPAIPAITVNNMGANSEIAWGIINLGTIGIDVTNSSVYKMHDLYITNQTTSGIRDNADGGAEHSYDSIWLINNNAAVNTSSLFQYVRTNTTDTGGLYMNNVRAIANILGGTVTNGFLLTSSAGGRTIIHSHLADTICDGNFNGDCVVLNNVQRVSVEGGQWGTSHANASCAAATVSCFASVSIIGSAQVDFSPNVKLISGNRDISFSGAVDRVTVAQSQLFGSAPAGGGHLFVVTGAALTNFSINSPSYDSATVYSNNEAALIAASSTAYSNTGSGTNSGIGFGDGATATPSLFFRADPGLGCWRSNTNTVTCNTTVSGPVWRWDNTGLSIISTFGFKPSAAGGVNLGTTLLPFGNLCLGTAATNNFCTNVGAIGQATAVSWLDPKAATAAISWQGGIPCTNGELVLSAGWGTTATVTAVVGLGWSCEWTVTSSGTGQAANPTLTDTLVLPVLSASVACEMRMVGGSGTATLIDQTTLSATAPIFTFLGTPVAASTYKVYRRC